MTFQIVRSKFHMSHGYEYIWQSILALPILVFPIPELVVEEP